MRVVLYVQLTTIEILLQCLSEMLSARYDHRDRIHSSGAKYGQTQRCTAGDGGGDGRGVRTMSAPVEDGRASSVRAVSDWTPVKHVQNPNEKM